VVAIRHHLEGLNLGAVLALLTGDDMKARLPFDPVTLSSAKATIYFEELLELLGGKSGLFSEAGPQK
jgi:hypothetical protein